MRNEALQELDGLVGDWKVTLTDAWFLESPDVRVVLNVTPDRLESRTDASEDFGKSWRKDFDLIFERR